MFSSQLYAMGAQGASTGGAAPSFPVVPLLLIMVMFWFLMIRPNQKQQKERKKMISELKEGDKVVTIGGIFATVNKVEDEVIVLKVSEGINIKATRQSVEKLQK